MGREREKRHRTTEIEREELRVAIQKAERKRDTEWTASMKTLQKQLGDEQKRVAQMQLQMSRNDTSYLKRLEEDELALSREQAARKLGEEGHKVA